MTDAWRTASPKYKHSARTLMHGQAYADLMGRIDAQVAAGHAPPSPERVRHAVNTAERESWGSGIIALGIPEDVPWIQVIGSAIRSAWPAVAALWWMQTGSIFALFGERPAVVVGAVTAIGWFIITRFGKGL